MYQTQQHSDQQLIFVYRAFSSCDCHLRIPADRSLSEKVRIYAANVFTSNMEHVVGCNTDSGINLRTSRIMGTFSCDHDII